VVVMGMHRSRTSMVAQMLHTMGVHMGDRLLGANHWNRWGHWEDLDFLELNEQMLKAARGSWVKPPPAVEVKSVGISWFMPEVEQLLRWKARQGRSKWGWKDPRNCLTFPVWWEGLKRSGLAKETRVVRVTRDEGEVVESLMRRTREAGKLLEQWKQEGLVSEQELAHDRELAGWKEEQWVELARTYEQAAEAAVPGGVERVTVDSGDLVKLRWEALVNLAVLADSGNVEGAMEVIGEPTDGADGNG
jgi:hypothetical protein